MTLRLFPLLLLFCASPLLASNMDFPMSFQVTDTTETTSVQNDTTEVTSDTTELRTVNTNSIREIRIVGNSVELREASADTTSVLQMRFDASLINSNSVAAALLTEQPIDEALLDTLSMYYLVERQLDSLPRVVLSDTSGANVPQVDTVRVDLEALRSEVAMAVEEEAEEALAEADTTVVEEEEINYWTITNTAGVNLNEVAFINWNSGGNNSISALTYANFRRQYRKDLLNWDSRFEIKYGLNAQQGRELRKTEDRLEIRSTFGYRTQEGSNWFYSAQFNFNTQLTFGYRYPDTSNPISKFMAPGYSFIGVGTEFSHPTEDFTFYLSPVTQKATFVLDQDLANQGSFGVEPAVFDDEGNMLEEGQKIRGEFGFLFSSDLVKQLSENISMNNRIRLYSDYLNNFGNVDIDWELNFSLRVNEYVSANVGSHLKYDDDVKFREDRNGDGTLEDVGPKVQFKQVLGVGLVYDF